MKCKSCASHMQRAMLFVATCSLVVVGPSLLTISGSAQPQDQIADVSTQLPPEVDTAWNLFKNKRKFYVVIGADTYGKETDKNLPFVKDTAERVADTLRALGYTELAYLTGEQATHDNVTAELNAIQVKAHANDIVVVYYNGHGVPDDNKNDVWLQLYGTRLVGPGFGITVSDILHHVRPNYEGELIVLIDACHSGGGINSRWANIGELGENTWILVSSSGSQESVTCKPAGETELSVFSYLFIRALTVDWDLADYTRCGVMTPDKVGKYLRTYLELYFKNGSIRTEMHPVLLANVSASQDFFFACRPAKGASPQCAYERGQCTALTVSFPPPQSTKQSSKQALISEIRLVKTDATGKETVLQAQSFRQGVTKYQFYLTRKTLESAKIVFEDDAGALLANQDLSKFRRIQSVEQKEMLASVTEPASAGQQIAITEEIQKLDIKKIGAELSSVSNIRLSNQTVVAIK